MKLVRVFFYKNGLNDQQEFLGTVDIIDNGTLSDGCSLIAKAFRMASSRQKDANSVELQYF